MDKLSVHAKRHFFPNDLLHGYVAYALSEQRQSIRNNDPTFTVSAPENIEINKQFRLTFIVSFPEKPATVEIQNLAVPELKGFKVLLGPTKSSATNVEK